MSFISWTIRKEQTRAPLVNNGKKYYAYNYEKRSAAQRIGPPWKIRVFLQLLWYRSRIHRHFIQHSTQQLSLYRQGRSCSRIISSLHNRHPELQKARRSRASTVFSILTWLKRGTKKGWNNGLERRGGCFRCAEKKMQLNASSEHEVTSFFLWFAQYVTMPNISETVFLSLLPGGN